MATSRLLVGRDRAWLLRFRDARSAGTAFGGEDDAVVSVVEAFRSGKGVSGTDASGLGANFTMAIFCVSSLSLVSSFMPVLLAILIELIDNPAHGSHRANLGRPIGQQG